MPVTTRRFVVATLFTGVIAGLVGLACIHLLHWIQALAWDMHSGTLLEAVSAVSPARRVLILTLGGVLGGASWFFSSGAPVQSRPCRRPWAAHRCRPCAPPGTP